MFRGSITALITPFKDEAVDEKAFQSFVQWQIDEGTHGLEESCVEGFVASGRDERGLRHPAGRVERHHDGHRLARDVGDDRIRLHEPRRHRCVGLLRVRGGRDERANTEGSERDTHAEGRLDTPPIHKRNRDAITPAHLMNR